MHTPSPSAITIAIALIATTLASSLTSCDTLPSGYLDPIAAERIEAECTVEADEHSGAVTVRGPIAASPNDYVQHRLRAIIGVNGAVDYRVDCTGILEVASDRFRSASDRVGEWSEPVTSLDSSEIAFRGSRAYLTEEFTFPLASELLVPGSNLQLLISTQEGVRKHYAIFFSTTYLTGVLRAVERTRADRSNTDGS